MLDGGGQRSVALSRGADSGRLARNSVPLCPCDASVWKAWASKGMGRGTGCALWALCEDAMNEAEAIVCDVRATMKYVVRGEKATFHPGEREKSYWPVDEHEVKIHDVRPIRDRLAFDRKGFVLVDEPTDVTDRSEEHTSELQSRENRVCRLLREKTNQML